MVEESFTKTFNITIITFYTEQEVTEKECDLKRHTITCYQKHTIASAKRYLNKLNIRYYPEIILQSKRVSYTITYKKFLEVATPLIK